MVPLANDPIMLGRSIQLFKNLENQNLSTGDDFIHSSGIIFCISFLANKELLATIAYVTMMSGISMQWLRHLQHQILSTGDDFIHSSGIMF